MDLAHCGAFLGVPLDGRAYEPEAPQPASKTYLGPPTWDVISSKYSRNLLPTSAAHLQRVSASLLLLDCEDICDVLRTVAAQKELRTNKQSKQFENLEFHLTSESPSVAARIVLLLCLAQDLDFTLLEDVDFFWTVWCHTALTLPQYNRLVTILRSLAASDFSGESPRDIHIQNTLHDAIVRKFFEIWAMDSGNLVLSGTNVAAKREAAFCAFPESTASRDMPVYATLTESLASNAMERLCSNKKGNAEKAIEEEVQAWFRTGMTTGPATDDMRANPTFLMPASGAWGLDRAACPFHALWPVSDKILTEISPMALAQKRVSIVEACREELASCLLAFSQVGHVVKLNFVVWLEESLQSVLHMVPFYWEGPPGEGKDGRSGICYSGEHEPLNRFDVIDTNRLADRVGQLNILGACAPLLKRSAASRLYTSSSRWHTFGSAVVPYLNLFLSPGVLQLLPSLLGLRLHTDYKFDGIAAGAICPRKVLKLAASQLIEPLFEWRPVGPVLPGREVGDIIQARRFENGTRDYEATPLHFLPSRLLSTASQQALHEDFGDFPRPCGLVTRLQSLFNLCCRLQVRVSGKDVLLHSCTPLTFCLILRHVIQDVDLDSSQDFSWEEYADSKPHFRMFRLTLSAMWRYLLTAGVMPLTMWLYSAAETLGMPGDLLMYRAGLGLKFGEWMEQRKGEHEGAVMVRVLLAEFPGGISGEAARGRVAPTKYMELGKKGKQRVHVIDNVSIHASTGTVGFLLPTDHALKKEEVLVIVFDSGGRLVAPPLSLASCQEGIYKSEKVKSGSAYHKRAAEPSPEKLDREYRGHGLGRTSMVRGVCDYEDCYRVALQMAAGDPGQVQVAALHGGEEPAWVIKVSVGSRYYAPVAFSWPVTWSNASIQVERRRGWMFCTFPKAARCPPSSIDVAESALDLESLALWPPTKVMETERMFVLQELVIMQRGGDLLRGMPYLDLRGLVYALYELHRGGGGVMVALGNKKGQGELMLLTKGVGMDSWGRPVIEMMYADLEVKGELLPDSALAEFANGALSQSYDSLISEDRLWHLGNSDPRDFRMVRELLKRNASLTKSSTWQQTRQGAPIWKATFITLLDSQGADPIPSLASSFDGLQQLTVQIERADLAAEGDAVRVISGWEGLSTPTKQTKHTKPTKVVLSKCEGCGKGGGKKVAPLLRCGRCMRVGYCNAQCQKGHWQEHKEACKKGT